MLGACREDCTLNGTDVPVDLCAGGSDVQAVLDGSPAPPSPEADAVDASLCSVADDCSSTEYCSFSETAAQCTCSASTGRDLCVSRGKCTDWCDQYAAQLEEFNSRFTACSADGDCGDGETCNLGLASSCQTMTCSAGTGVAIESCDGICVPANRNMASAKFGDSGSTIEVTLNFAALSTGFACSDAFDAATVTSLGAAFCFVSGKTLTVMLRGGADIVAGDTLTLGDGQTRLVDILPQANPFTGGVTLSNCDNCVTPIVACVYSPVMSAGCGSSIPDAVFDATYSLDTAGRSLTFGWSLDTSSCYATTADPTTFTTHSDCDGLKTLLEAEQTGTFVLAGSDIDALTPGTYKFTVTATNFLGQDAPLDVQVLRASSPVPMVSIVGDSVQRFMLSRGTKVSAFIDTTSVCDGYKVDYKWVSIDSPLWSAIPADGVPSKDLLLKPPIAGQAEYPYKLRMTADLKNANGEVQGSSSTEVTLRPFGSDVRAYCEGPAGDVLLDGDITLDASKSLDPDDPFNQVQSFAYEWSCSLEDGSPCFSGKTGPKSATGTTVVLGPDSLTANVRKYHLYTVTVSKKEQGPEDGDPVVVRKASAMCIFRPQDASSPMPTGKAVMDCGDLPCPARVNPTEIVVLKVTDLKYADTTVSWSSSAINDLSSMTVGGVNNAVLFIKPDMLEGGAEYQFVATLSRGGEQGETVVPFATNAAPFCGRADGQCFTLSVDDPCEFPTCQVVATAKEFADDQPGMVYEFYWLSNTGFEVDTAQLDAAAEEMQKAIDSGCTTCVMKGALKTVFFLRYAGNGRRRSLLQAVSNEVVIATTGETAQQVLDQIPATAEEIDLDSYKSSQGVLAGIARDGNLAGNMTEKVLAAVKVGLTAQDYASSPATPSQAQEVVDIVADALAKHSRGEGALSSAMFYQLMKDNVALISKLACLTATAGSGAVSTSSMETDAVKLIGMTCAKEAPATMVGMTFSAGVASEASAARRRLLEGAAVPKVTVPEGFHPDCGDGCPDTATLSLEFYEDPAAHLNLTGAPIAPVGATNLEILTGVLSMWMTGNGATELCPRGECNMTARIPVDASLYDLSKTTECMLIEDGRLVGLAGGSIKFAGYEGTYAACNTTKLGEMLVVQYTEPEPEPEPEPIPLPEPEPVPEPPPTGENETSTPPPTDNGTQPAPPTNQVRVELTFDGALAELENDAEFRNGIVRQIRTYATPEGGTPPSVTIIGMRSGSVIVDVAIEFAQSSSNRDIVEFVDTLENDAGAVFTDTAFTNAYGMPTVEITDTDNITMPPPPAPKEEDDGGGVNIGVVAGATIGGVVGLAAIIVGIWMCCRKARYSQQPSGGGYEPA
ncbi:unnamed protein product [Ostreobium quekettii]|uniref:PKD/REJ-like domain-containing protein n=1 Tax=Ostreobium quekettii TaxID=121088 RepID=A0A8S1J2I3_9CHLO|nr:unnamed protein product [Ostreobium quekettii]